MGLLKAIINQNSMACSWHLWLNLGFDRFEGIYLGLIEHGVAKFRPAETGNERNPGIVPPTEVGNGK